MGVILANVIVLAMDRKNIADKELMALERANIVFAFVFGFEMVCSCNIRWDDLYFGYQVGEKA